MEEEIIGEIANTLYAMKRCFLSKKEIPNFMTAET